MKRICVCLLILGFAMPIGAQPPYDAALANSFAGMFAGVQGEQAGTALHLVKPDGFLESIKQDKPMVALDVRTPAELGIYGMTLPRSLAIPISRLFEPDNLARLPTQEQVVVICKSGTRAMAAGIGLRAIGYDNVYVLQGGLVALAAYIDPKSANAPPVVPDTPKP